MNIQKIKDIFFWGFILLVSIILLTGKLTRYNLIIILLIVLGFILFEGGIKLIKKETNLLDIDKPKYPTNKYMNNIGGLCPDYWTFKKYNKNGNPICENEFNISVEPKNGYDKCYDNNSINRKTFKKIIWPVDDTVLSSSGQCKWIKNCGPTDGRASWLGIDDKC